MAIFYRDYHVPAIMFKLPMLCKLLTLRNLLILPDNSINDEPSILDTAETVNNTMKILYTNADQYLNKRDLRLLATLPQISRH